MEQPRERQDDQLQDQQQEQDHQHEQQQQQQQQQQQDDDEEGCCVDISVRVSSTRSLRLAVLRQQKKCVRFALTNEYIDSDDNNNSIFTPANITWYEKHDYACFRHDCCDTVELSRNGLLNDDKLTLSSHFSERGIEHMISREAGNIRRNRREHARAIVLQEQFDQLEEGEYSPQVIADLYEELSSQCRIDAHKVGLEDAAKALAQWCTSDKSMIVPISAYKTKEDKDGEESFSRGRSLSNGGILAPFFQPRKKNSQQQQNNNNNNNNAKQNKRTKRRGLRLLLPPMA